MGCVDADAGGAPDVAGSFLGATAPACGFTGAPAAGFWGAVGRAVPAAGRGNLTIGMLAGGRYCGGRELTPVLTCGAVLCCPRAGSPSRRDKPQIVRESRAIGILRAVKA